MPAQPDPDYDVLIVGAGAVGASLACALADSRLRIGVVEATARAGFEQTGRDGRGLALALGTRRILEQLSVWPALVSVANPIRHIHVSNRGHFGVVRLHADQIGAPALGYVVPAQRLGQALLECMDRAANIDWHCPARLTDIEQQPDRVSAGLARDGASLRLHARLLVAADGAQSLVRGLLGIETRQKDYGQVAIVSSVQPARAHGDTAWERFTDTGPLAVLPLCDGRCVVVCSVATDEAESILALTDEDFLALLHDRFGPRLGMLTRPGPRHSYPIRLVEALEQRRGRVLLLGNAAHTVHPNAAQGYNLGLRDAAALARHLRTATDAGAAELLSAYLAERSPDQQRVIRFTDTLARVFYENWPCSGPLRSLGMLALDLTPPLKRSFTRRLAAPAIVRCLT